MPAIGRAVARNSLTLSTNSRETARRGRGRPSPVLARPAFDRLKWLAMRKPVAFLVLALVAFLCDARLLAQGASPAASGGAGATGLDGGAAVLPDDPASLLGMGLVDALARFGSPSRVEVSRGAEAWQDDVVFVYGAGTGLYWATDRLWQIRFTPGYPGSIYGIFLGDAADKVVSTLGTPYYQDEANLVFRLPFRGYPVRLRVVISGGAVKELYVYRADF